MSNKTLKRHAEKTVSEHSAHLNGSRLRLAIGIIMVIFGGWLLLYGFSGLADSRKIVITPNGKIHVEIADNNELRYQGLSGRSSIDGGMLFVYDNSSKDHCLVMRDMSFAIDMVWLDSSKNVVSVANNVTPETYPEVFCPSSAAKYALELQAGEAERLGIAHGVNLVF